MLLLLAGFSIVKNKLENRLVKLRKEQLSKISKGMPITLCSLVIVCYGIYLLQSFRSALSFAFNYNQDINVVQVTASLYFFGKLGLSVHATIESGILLGYVMSKIIAPRQFMYLLVLVIISNLVIFFFVSNLYEYAITIIQ